MSSDQTDFDQLSVEETIARLEADLQHGLSPDAASQRLAKYGPNALEEKKVSLWAKVFAYFWGPIPWMIEVAAVLSLAVQHYVDFIIIMTLLIFNAAIGFLEERKASNALDALKSALALKARTLRNGQWQEIEARDLVPGDVVRLRLGDIIPADVKLVDGAYLSVDQAALTGESLPVNKKVGDSAFSGSIAKQGEMIAVVTGTGTNTFFGRTARLVQSAGNVSHFQKAVLKIGNFLIFLALALAVILSAVELHRGASIIDLLQFVLILVVASIPVAMPAVLSVTMALGAVALSKMKAIVSRLQAIEEMAGVDILCSDKTGTLTKNELTLGEPVLLGARDGADVLRAGAWASKAENNDAIDLCVLEGAEKGGGNDYVQESFTPFDPISKRTEATVRLADGTMMQASKGAPQVILDLCGVAGEDLARAQKVVDDFAATGYRTLGVARRAGDGDWTFLGILPLSDPPRDDSAATITNLRAHGLDVKMVTGDDTAIASETCRQLSLGTRIQPAANLFAEGVDPANLNEAQAHQVEKADGYARVFPEHKYGIVKALQKQDHLVAMTGDGVNDAPALKQADVGIAVSGATDAARAAADLVLTAPGLSVIANAVEEARRIFERMMSYTIYRIAMTIDIMMFVVLSTIIFEFRPLTAVMIILLALLDDVPIMTIAYDNTRVSKTPVRWQMGRVLTIASVLGFAAVVQSFGLLIILETIMTMPAAERMWDIHQGHVQSMLFQQLVGGGHLMLLVCRSDQPFWKPPYPANTLLVAVFGTQLFAYLMVGFGWLMPAVPWDLVLYVAIYNFLWMFVMDGVKLGTYRVMNHGLPGWKRTTGFVNEQVNVHPTGPVHKDRQ